jgi:murein DD-endopeptidase MepM/ murein hydrolase activator NlpD
VKAGDTLLGIALNLGVDLDALRAANSGIDPYALQIGQTLIVPSAQANPLTLVALPTPTPLALVLPPPTCYPARTGGTLCLGLVENPFDQTVQNVRLSIQLMGDNGAFLSSQETDVAQFIVPPKGLAPYHVQFADAGSSAAGASAVLLSAEFLPQGDASFLQLEVQDDHGVSVDQQYVVTAELYNAATSAAESVRVVVTLFDADGGVIGYRVMMLETPLPSGERLPIRAVILSVNNAVPTRYTIYAEGRAGKS